MLKATSGYIEKGKMQSRVWRPVVGMRGSVTERLVENISYRKNVSNTREGTGDTTDTMLNLSFLAALFLFGG